MKNKIIVLLSGMLLSGVAFAAIDAGAARSMTIATIADSIYNTQLVGIAEVISAISYISGLALGVKGILKLKEHNESKGQVKLTVPIVMVIAGAMFLALPTLLKVGIQTMGMDKTSVKNFNLQNFQKESPRY